MIVSLVALARAAAAAESDVVAANSNKDLDKDGSGLLSFDELADFLQQIDDETQSRDDLRVLFNKFDADNDNMWSKEEFRTFKQSLRFLVTTGKTASIVFRVLVAVVVVLVSVLLCGVWYIRSLISAPAKAVAAALASHTAPTAAAAAAVASVAASFDGDAEDLRALRHATVIPAETLVLTRSHLGQGIGGTVVVGRWQDTTDVACKTLRANCTQREINDFLSEIKLILTLPMHPNILQVFGVSTIDNTLVLVMEYLPLGNMLDSLRKKTLGDDEEQFSLTQLLLFAQDICKGMVHLSTHNIVHRDLAARNVLLSAQDSRFIAKVCDFGLSRTVEYLDVQTDEPTPSANPRALSQSVSGPVGHKSVASAASAAAAGALPCRDVCAAVAAALPCRSALTASQSSDGYADVDDAKPPPPPQRSESTLPPMPPKSPVLRRAPSTESKPLPIKWMAPETLFGKYSPASDVWAYGVVLFEIFSFGEEPYSGFTALEVLRRHRRNQPLLMERPEACPDDVYDTMLDCWKTRASDRPTFQQLHRRVDDLLLAHDDAFFESSSSSSSKLWAAAHRRHANRRSASPSPSPQPRRRSASRTDARSESSFSLTVPDARGRRNSFSLTADVPPVADVGLKRRSRSLDRLAPRAAVAGYVDEPFAVTPAGSVAGTSTTGAPDSADYVAPTSVTDANAMPYALDDSEAESDYIEPEPTLAVPRIVLTASIDDE